MLTTHALHCRRGNRTVLSNIDVELRPGEVLGVLGANGAGKTTLLSTLAGELPASGGEIALGGKPLAHWSPDALARVRAVLPQSPTLSFDLVVRDVVAMGAYPFPELAPAPHDVLLRHVLGLAHAEAFIDRRYLSLSGGERQRVQFARTLMQTLACHEPGEYRVLMLDEPTSSLDPKHQITLLAAVRTLAHRENIAVLVVLHDVNLAAQWCDRLLLLTAGHVAACGTAHEVLAADILETVYHVPAHVLPHPVRNDIPLVMFGQWQAR